MKTYLHGVLSIRVAVIIDTEKEIFTESARRE